MTRRTTSRAADRTAVHLRSLAARLRYAPIDRDGSLVALNRVRVTPEPYQVESVHRMVSAPRARFMLADDVGLGKTIQTGLLMAELAARGRARRVLVVVPAALRDQWVEEMAEKFNERFTIYDGKTIKRLRKQLPKDVSPWGFHSRVITSLDFIKRKKVADEVTSVDWDLVVFDEAHKLGVTLNGGKVSRTARFRVAERLSEIAESVLVLTATPHHGDQTAFQGLLSLCDPFVTPDAGAVSPARLRGLMIRRGKGEIRGTDGKPTFVKRQVRTVEVKMRPDEWDLYNGVTEYVREAYQEAQDNGDVVGGFAMVLLQKRLCSSVWALRESLRRRVDTLRNRPKRSPLGVEELSRYLDAYGNPEDWDDDTLQMATELEAALDRYALPDRETADEITKLDGLLQLADSILRKGDSKVRTLQGFVEGLMAERKNGKLLLFTEYSDTLTYIQAKLKGYKIWTIHGKVKHKDRRRIVQEFNAPGPGILLATDAAGEGLNMQQRCHLMVNYELPWNPNRMDQRIGRLHRYGQKREVKVWNFSAAGTREGAIFDLLSSKVKAMEEALGGKVSDVLGSVLRRFKLTDLLMDALAQDQSPRA
ncbi:MAG: helicase-related protein, partial [Planctomycetota bacterium]